MGREGFQVVLWLFFQKRINPEGGKRSVHQHSLFPQRFQLKGYSVVFSLKAQLWLIMAKCFDAADLTPKWNWILTRKFKNYCRLFLHNLEASTKAYVLLPWQTCIHEHSVTPPSSMLGTLAWMFIFIAANLLAVDYVVTLCVTFPSIRSVSEF